MADWYKTRMHYKPTVCIIQPSHSEVEKEVREPRKNMQSAIMRASLCCFHTSLTLCSANTACSFTANTERCYRNGSLQSSIAPKLNWSQLYAICHCGQSGKVIDDVLARLCLPLGHSWVASAVCAVVQNITIKAASGKAGLKAALVFCT